MQDIEVGQAHYRRNDVSSGIAPRWQGALENIGMPLRVLLLGRATLLLYVGVGTLGVFYLFNYLNHELQNFVITLSRDSRLSDTMTTRLSFVASMVCWTIAIPIVLAVHIVPVRAAWLEGKLRLTKLLSMTPLATQICFQSALVGIKRSLIFFVPLVGAVVLYFASISSKNWQTLSPLMLVITGLIGVFSIVRASPTLSLPFLCVAGEVPPLIGEQLSRTVFKQHAYWAIFLCLIVLTLSAVLHLAFSLLPSSLFSWLVEMLTLTTLWWYGLALISLKNLQMLADFSAATKERASQYQNGYGGQPIYINAQNLVR